jgi:hypothetical protein
LKIQQIRSIVASGLKTLTEETARDLGGLRQVRG